VTLPALLWLLLATIWGSTWLFIKVGLQDLPPFTFAAIRFVVASAPLVAWLAIRRRPLRYPAADWRLMVVTGLLTFTVNYALVFWGELHVSAGLAALIYTTFPILGMLQAHWLLHDEPLTARRLSGAVLALGSVAVIFHNQIDLRGPMALLGSAAILVAATGTAYADVLVKKSGVHIDPVTMTAVQMVAGVIPLLALGLVVEGSPFTLRWTTRAVVCLLYLALVGSSVTFVTLYWLIRRMQVTRVMLIPLLSTVIAVTLDAMILGERLHWRTLAGGLGVLAGLVIAVGGPRARPRLRDSSRTALARDDGTGHA
jgi:drug/metabolite transporter (DMT)-like permease